MPDITREYLDNIDTGYALGSDEAADLIGALRRVLDLCDKADTAHALYLEGPIFDRFIMPSNIQTAHVRDALASAKPEESTP